MIYLENTTTGQNIYFPRSHGGQGDEVLELELTSVIDRDSHSLDCTKLDETGLYFRLSVCLPSGLDPGEYEWKINERGITLASGLAMVGAVSSTPTEYEKTITYEQYNAE